MPVPCLPHLSSCAAPKCPCAAAPTQHPCWLSRPLALTEGTWTFALLSSCPSIKMVSWPPASPRCEGSKAVRRGGTRLLGQEGSREQQPITASWCQQGFRPPSPEGQVMQEAGEGRAGPYQDPYLSSLPPCCSSRCPFPPFPAEPLSSSSTLFTLHATPPPTHL